VDDSLSVVVVRVRAGISEGVFDDDVQNVANELPKGDDDQEVEGFDKSGRRVHKETDN
jgi:hypothetical protein